MSEESRNIYSYNGAFMHDPRKCSIDINPILEEEKKKTIKNIKRCKGKK